jgi:hypothetical protein
MPKKLDKFRFLLLAVAGWVNQRQRHAIESFQEKEELTNQLLFLFFRPPGNQYVNRKPSCTIRG